MNQNIYIIIKGEVGSGKSTAAEIVAHALEHCGKFSNIVMKMEAPIETLNQLPNDVVTAKLTKFIKL